MDDMRPAFALSIIVLTYVVSGFSRTVIAETRQINTEQSKLTVFVYKSGLFSAFADDHVIDGSIVVAHADVGEPRREVRGALAPESVLRRKDKLGFMSRFAQRLHERARHHQMAPFHKERRRRDDGDARHVRNDRSACKTSWRRVARDPSWSSTYSRSIFLTKVVMS